ncbi:MAG TPA: helix-turn-helix domain-containing protein [Acidimicrobiia bacterium]|nr:helix-turn-helix domain-containing protein [Acidimicrobiia bacterium]
MTVEPKTRESILTAAKEALLEAGYARLSTRRIAEAARVPLSQIHYHFGSKSNLVLEVLEEENRRLLQRQEMMYGQEMPLWKRWEQACDFLEDDLESGYVRVLQEMTAAGWSDDEVAAAVREDLQRWFALLEDVAGEAAARMGGLGPFTPAEVSVLAGAPFLGIEALMLLGFTENQIPMRSALRKTALLIRSIEEGHEG